MFDVKCVTPKQLEKLILKQKWGKKIFLLKKKLRDIGIETILTPIPISYNRNMYYAEYVEESKFLFNIIFKMNSTGTKFQDEIFIWFDRLCERKSH